MKEEKTREGKGGGGGRGGGEEENFKTINMVQF